jgi:hypothetical protein
MPGISIGMAIVGAEACVLTRPAVAAVQAEIRAGPVAASPTSYKQLISRYEYGERGSCVLANLYGGWRCSMATRRQRVRSLGARGVRS